MTTQEILTAIGFIGIGGLLKSLADFFVSKRKQKAENKQQFKETRYKAITLLCYSLINYERESAILVINRPDITSKERLYNELNAEWTNMILFASDKVLLAMKKFLEKEDISAFNNLIIAMRKDLYGIKTKIKVQDLLLTKNNSLK